MQEIFRIMVLLIVEKENLYGLIDYRKIYYRTKNETINEFSEGRLLFFIERDSSNNEMEKEIQIKQ